MAVKAGFQPAYQEVRAVEKGDKATWPDSLVLKLGAECQDLAGTVIDSHGKPIPEAHVWIDDATWFANETWQPLVLECLMAGGGTAPAVKADKEGRFKIRGLEARTYRVGALDPRTLAVAKADAPAGTSNAQITVAGSDVLDKVAGIVVDKSGKPVPGIEITVQRNTFVISMGRGSYSSGAGRSAPSAPAPTAASSSTTWRAMGSMCGLRRRRSSPRANRSPRRRTPTRCASSYCCVAT